MTQESNKFPTKTTIGAGILLLLFWHGKGFGFGKGGSGFRGEGKGPQPLGFTDLGLVPSDLQKLLLTDPNGTRPADTIQLVTVQRGSNFTGRDTPQDFVFAKSPGSGEAMSMADLLGFGDWFRRGRLNLVIRINGATLHGNVLLLQRKLTEAGIPAVYLEPVVNADKTGFVWGQRPEPPKGKVKDLRAAGFNIPASFPDEAEVDIPILTISDFDFKALTS
jgi:hypothetical protein